MKKYLFALFALMFLLLPAGLEAAIANPGSNKVRISYPADGAVIRSNATAITGELLAPDEINLDYLWRIEYFVDGQPIGSTSSHGYKSDTIVWSPTKVLTSDGMNIKDVNISQRSDHVITAKLRYIPKSLSAAQLAKLPINFTEVEAAPVRISFVPPLKNAVAITNIVNGGNLPITDGKAYFHVKISDGVNIPARDAWGTFRVNFYLQGGNGVPIGPLTLVNGNVNGATIGIFELLPRDVPNSTQVYVDRSRSMNIENINADETEFDVVWDIANSGIKGTPGSQYKVFAGAGYTAVINQEGPEYNPEVGPEGTNIGRFTDAITFTLGGTTASPSSVPGCLPGYLFSPQTGQPCTGTSNPPGCQPGYNFSPVTGERCVNTFDSAGGGDAGGGDSGSDDENREISRDSRVNFGVSANPDPLAPLVNVNITPGTVAQNAAATINWSSTRSQSCTSDAWEGIKGSSGSATINPVRTRAYSVTCTNNLGKSSTARATVTIGTASRNADNGADTADQGTDADTGADAGTGSGGGSIRYGFFDGGTVSIKEGVTSVNVRATPSLTGALRGTQSYIAFGKILGNSVSADAKIWWNVDFSSGADGWVSQEFLYPGVSNDMLARGITGDTSNQWGYNTNENFDYDLNCSDGEFPERVQVPGRGSAKAVWVPQVWEAWGVGVPQLFTCKKVSQNGNYVVPETFYSPAEAVFDGTPFTRDPEKFNNSLVAVVKYLGNGETEIKKVFVGKSFHALEEDVTVTPSTDQNAINHCKGIVFSGEGKVWTPSASRVVFNDIDVTANICTYSCDAYNKTKNLYMLPGGEITADGSISSPNNYGVGHISCVAS